MDNVMETISKLKDPSTYTDITPEDLKKLFDKISGSPEKLRTALNQLFIPNFTPAFIDDQVFASDGVDHVEFLEDSLDESLPRPLRLIDLETGNLVDSWKTSSLDSYCMLSHRWKGDEITLAHIRRAREQHTIRSKTESAWADECQRLKGDATPIFLKNCARISGVDTDLLVDRRDDLHLVLQQSILDILEQEDIVRSLIEKSSTDPNIEELLQHRIRANDSIAGVNWARQAVDAKKSKLERIRVGENAMRQITNRIRQGSIDADMDAVSTDGSNSEVSAAQQDLQDAQDKLKEAKETHRLLQSDNGNSDSIKLARVDEAVDEMISRLQRWKSAVKLIRSAEEARKLFKTRVFRQTEARYIWSDTCCIDKANYGELSQSLSLMGDWYENAEFCVVHLDTPSQLADAIRDWKDLHADSPAQLDCPVSMVQQFGEIKGSNPEWSSRAWTLQELVMSKMAFFVNPEWKSLSRPIESLGYVYPLIPFVALYASQHVSNKYVRQLGITESPDSPRPNVPESLHTFLDLDKIEVIEGSHQSPVESTQARKGVLLVAILHALEFIFPTDLTIETATSELGRRVYSAASGLVSSMSSGSGNSIQLLKALKRDFLAVSSGSDDPVTVEGVQDIINFLLCLLVAETKDLIVADREYISHFGEIVQLDTWKEGTARTGFPAQHVFQLCCQRKATVPVDHVYSLMGVLGVRFPSFHAEGLPKALSRLLDEVIIAHNDVSVFNWSGVEMGSPVRGRSLYPASHKAYEAGEDRGRRYNIQLSKEAREKMHKITTTYHGIIDLLRNAIDCIKSKGNGGIPLKWIREICSFIQTFDFDKLEPEVVSLGKVLVYINQISTADKTPTPKSNNEEPNSPSIPQEAPNPSSDAKSSFSSMKIPSFGKSPKLPSFGIGISKPSFGRHASEPISKVTTKIEEEPKVPPQPEWMSLDTEVTEYMKALGSDEHSTEQRSSLPSKIAELKFTPKRHDSADTSHEHRPKSISLNDTTCPNPIIINNSGIDGIFDIQRIIVTMVDREQLQRQVKMAVSPKQKIRGWCTLSTGFASVAVNFACERDILRKQLEVEEAVEDTLIKESRAQKLHVGLEIFRGGQDKTNESTATEAAAKSDDQEVQDGGETNSKQKVSSKPTKEEQTVARIIDFIQEPQLQLVAGEWVLARFSGVEGAKWFLCNLELGSTHQFYGRRIATTEIDFSNSSVEPGLINAWQTYMARKKRKMCGILDMYLQSFESAEKGQDRLKTSSDIASRNLERVMSAGNQSLENVMSMGTMPTDMLKTTFFQGTEEIKVSTHSDSDDEENEINKFFADILDQGKTAAMALGEYTVFAAYEKICGLQASHLDKHLAASVLKRTPKSLQTAVEGVDENKNFLPAMFHASKRVHMF